MDSKLNQYRGSSAAAYASAAMSAPFGVAQLLVDSHVEAAKSQIRARQAARQTDTPSDRIGDRLILMNAQLKGEMEAQALFGLLPFNILNLTAFSMTGLLLMQPDNDVIRPLFSGYDATKT